MVRNIIAIIAGVIVGGVVVALMEMAGHSLFPVPEGDWMDPEFVKQNAYRIPFMAKFAVVIAWGVGAFAGGVTARLLSARWKYATLIIGLIFLAFAAINLVMIPSPLWMVLSGVTFIIAGATCANMLTHKRLK